MVIMPFVSINQVFAELSIVECFYDKSASMLPIVAMNDHSLILFIEFQKGLYRLLYILPTNIVNLLV